MKTTALLCALLVSMPAVAQEKKKADPQVERGRYIVRIGGCNDCHTFLGLGSTQVAGYAKSNIAKN